MELILNSVMLFLQRLARRAHALSGIRMAVLLLSGALLCSCATTSNRESAAVPPAKEGLRVIAAVYGGGCCFADVTEKVNQALTGEPGQFTISNGWVGSDPLPYHGKSLAVLYSYRGERYVFGAKEDSLVSLGTMMDTSSPAGAPLTHRGGRISGDDGDLVVVAAVYGSENGFGDATQEVAQSLKGGPPFFRATNAWFQHDPNPGWDKSLIIIYHYRNHRALFATTENGKVSYARLVLEAREAVAP